MGAPGAICPRCAAGLLQATHTEMPGSEGGNRTFTPPTVADLTPRFPQLEILELLGRGGMGAVYKARQKELDRVVALKILPPGIGEDPAFAERFAREAKALARLNHPGIVTIHDFGRVDGLYYFLMEFVDGVSLHRLLEGGRLSPREALAIVPQICDALQYAHDQGIVHRDIKPQNILLDRRGRVKVADFGLAKLVGQGEATGETALGVSSTAWTEAGKVMGTPAYMAPEQREQPSAVDHRADIYALGVVLYQLLTGELPGKPLEAPSRKVQIDVRLDEVVLKAMETVPGRRYEQASQFKTAVEDIASPSHETPGAQGENVANFTQGAPGFRKAEHSQPRWWQIFVAGFLTVLLLEFGALVLTERGPGPLVLAMLAGGVAVAIFLIARQVWLNALLVGMAIAFFSWLAVVAASTVAFPLAVAAGLIGVAVYAFAMKRLGGSRAFFTGFMAVFLVVFGASAAITFIMPDSFVSIARVLVSPAANEGTNRNPSGAALGTYNPYFIQTQLQVIASDAVLREVVENLKLSAEWDKRYGRGRAFTANDAGALLRSRMDIRPLRKSNVIEIRAFDESPIEAAEIANQVAQVYAHEQAGAGASASGLGPVRIAIIDQAIPAMRPARPNKPVNLAIGALAGALLGTAGGAGLTGFRQRRRSGPK